MEETQLKTQNGLLVQIICAIICIVQHWGRLTLFEVESVASKPWLKLILIIILILICIFCTVRTWYFAADSLSSSSLCSLWLIILSIALIVLQHGLYKHTQTHTKLSEYFKCICNLSIHIKFQCQKLTRQKLHKKNTLNQRVRRLQKIVFPSERELNTASSRGRYRNAFSVTGVWSMNENTIYIYIYIFTLLIKASAKFKCIDSIVPFSHLI